MIHFKLFFCSPSIIYFQIREKELKVLKENSYINAIAMFSWSCAPFFVSLVTFLIYALAIGDLTAEKV